MSWEESPRGHMMSDWAFVPLVDERSWDCSYKLNVTVPNVELDYITSLAGEIVLS
jgi:hypothetical protein